jgi:hypothetical protein
MSKSGGAQDHMPNGGGAGHPRGADGATIAGRCSCTSLISRAFPHLWPRGAEISFCLTIDHCRTILYYTVLYRDLAPRRRYCRLFTLLFRPGGLTGSQTLTKHHKESIQANQELIEALKIQVDGLQSVCQTLGKIVILGDVSVAGLRVML